MWCGVTGCVTPALHYSHAGSGVTPSHVLLTPMSPEPLDPHPDNPGSHQLSQYSHAGTSHSLPSQRLREGIKMQISQDDARLTRQKCIRRGVRWLDDVRVSSYQYLVPGIMILPPRAPHDCEFPPPRPHKWRYQTKGKHWERRGCWEEVRKFLLIHWDYICAPLGKKQKYIYFSIIHFLMSVQSVIV